MLRPMIRNHSISGTVLFGLVLFIGLAIYPASEGLAECQDYWTPEYKCLMGCGPCGDSAPVQQTRPVYRGPSAAEIAAQQAAAAQRQREAAATAQNEQGIKADRNGNYSRALAYFEKALEISPNDPVIQGNVIQGRKNVIKARMLSQNEAGLAYEREYDYRKAVACFANALELEPGNSVLQKNLADARESLRGQEAQEQREKQQRIQDKASADEMTASLSRMVNSLSSDNNSGNPDRKMPGGTSARSAGLEFTDSDPSLRDSVGGAPSDKNVAADLLGSKKANPGDLIAVPAPTPGTDKAGDQLLAAAAAAGAKGDLTINYDIGGAKSAGSLNIHKVIGQSPGAAALAAHIRDQGKKDTVIQQSIIYYEKLDGLKIDTQTKLAAVQQQIDSGAGDAKALNAQKSTLSNDLKRYDSDQANTQAQIKERLVKIGLPWNEGPPPATGAPANP